VSLPDVPAPRPAYTTLPPFAHSTLDHATHLRTDPAWLTLAWERSRVFVVEGSRTLLRDGRLLLLEPATAPAGDRLFLGIDADGTPYFAVMAALSTVDHSLTVGALTMDLREVGHLLSELDAGLFITAVALSNWHARHRFAPGSGLATSVTEGGWVRVDEAGSQYWPRTDPAVIVLVHDGVAGEDGRCLLGHNAAWTRGGGAGTIRRYSCLAGFVEAGESAEQTLLREVLEEVGVHVTQLRYVASQAWPYPGSLMLGFLACADPAEPIRVDVAEIADARWFTRAEIRRAAAADPAVGFAISPPSSIAHFLIMTWLAEG
jgi:NAD+ diphosphatase